MPAELTIETSVTGVEHPLLRIVFTHDRDRWTHEIQLITCDAAIALARSVDDDSADGWPESPVLQELTEHSIEDQKVLLGVGMAGSSHWSMSAGVDDAQRANFDVACLAKQEPVGWLGSNYQIAEDVTIGPVSAEAVGLEKDCCRIIFRAVCHDAWGTRLAIRDRQLMATPTHVSVSGSQSSRWGYSIEYEEKRRER